MQHQLKALSNEMAGELYYDSTAPHQAHLLAYSTDASVYQEKPLAVALPKQVSDLKLLINFAQQHKITLIPRAAGTSLAGQVVGNGVVVDMSKYFNDVIEINTTEKWVRVQPGVIRDDLNKKLLSHGLMFGPETSTSSRAMIGGMVGNNSSGLHSIVWGDTRENLLEVQTVLSDGSEVLFKEEPIIDENHSGLKKDIYAGLMQLLSDKEKQATIKKHFPKDSVHRRNTGYAVDRLLLMQPFSSAGTQFNLCKLIAGSEGTLLFVTEVKLRLIDLPPKETALVCVHCSSIDESLRANIVALRNKPMASELVDRTIMNFTRQHPEYRKNCFFVEGDPAAILMVEFMADTKEKVEAQVRGFIDGLKQSGYGYAFPVLYNQDTKYAWEVRKAGLGLLRNEPGDLQPVNLIEDCAVDPEELPDYINDLQLLLDKHGVKASYYAHAGAGELHVEPMINLKSATGLALFRTILAETVVLVKKYNGSLSGEHGDGRLRGEYIPELMGKETYEIFKKIKSLFDPHAIFNKGKIVDSPPMDTSLRVSVDKKIPDLKTTFNFSGQGGILRLAEKCSGSGDCRKSELTGGTMCPSFMATRNEKDSTRARANVLRQYLSDPHDVEPLNHNEIKEVMDLCLSCKACKTECPSAVDITKMKAEFLQQYYDKNGIPFRSKLIGNFSGQMKLASAFYPLYNFVFKNRPLRSIANKLVGFHPDRSIPLLPSTTLLSWYRKRKKTGNGKDKKLYFFCDEFTNYYDVEAGKKAILLLEGLGYHVEIPSHVESGRTWLSKGLVKKAAIVINQNIQSLSPIVSAEAPIVGIEPSAILTLRDEYIDLATEQNRAKAVALSAHVFTIEEFIVNEQTKGNISKQQFTEEKKMIAAHGHCYQKTLSSQHYSNGMLSLPANYVVQIIPSGCCGMAGSFGYEKEHFNVSQSIGELVLFPTVRNLTEDVLVAASGTSCRHQIKDGTKRLALHPAEILFDALLNKEELLLQL
ncbi:MAG TPA: FAD-linked oxidase C-terminal domain-containing protein [Chitinophagaceae bacterium]